MRGLIRSAVPEGYRPAEIRQMIPRDWLLIAESYAARAQANKPGANAPSLAEVEALIAEYG
ncbi:MAG: hypothetical protein ACU0E9_07765 [Limimaricola soesokkakensis]|uniref:hypothetical protein n=1 Tax=Limimaricola soesokkakensis TaxID=1343159 RepID=UPI0040582446